MKKNKEKKKERNDGTMPWCPLFGIVFPSGSYPPASQSSRCLIIIRDARAIWDIYDYSWHLLKSEPLNPSWPEPEEVDYPRDLLIVARDISNNFIGISSDAAIPGRHIAQGEQDWYKKIDGTYETYYSLDTNPEDAIEAAKRRALGEAGEIIEKIPDFAILAILAIEEAWFALTCIEEDGEPEDDLFILKSVQMAQSLLSQAEVQAQEKKADSYIKSLECDAKLGQKIRSRNKNLAEIGIKERVRRVESNRKKWLSVYCEHKKKKENKNKKTRSIALLAFKDIFYTFKCEKCMKVFAESICSTGMEIEKRDITCPDCGSSKLKEVHLRPHKDKRFQNFYKFILSKKICN